MLSVVVSGRGVGVVRSGDGPMLVPAGYGVQSAKLTMRGKGTGAGSGTGSARVTLGLRSVTAPTYQMPEHIMGTATLQRPDTEFTMTPSRRSSEAASVDRIVFATVTDGRDVEDVECVLTCSRRVSPPEPFEAASVEVRVYSDQARTLRARTLRPTATYYAAAVATHSSGSEIAVAIEAVAGCSAVATNGNIEVTTRSAPSAVLRTAATRIGTAQYALSTTIVPIGDASLGLDASAGYLLRKGVGNTDIPLVLCDASGPLTETQIRALFGGEYPTIEVNGAGGQLAASSGVYAFSASSTANVSVALTRVVVGGARVAFDAMAARVIPALAPPTIATFAASPWNSASTSVSVAVRSADGACAVTAVTRAAVVRSTGGVEFRTTAAAVLGAVAVALPESMTVYSATIDGVQCADGTRAAGKLTAYAPQTVLVAPTTRNGPALIYGGLGATTVPIEIRPTFTSGRAFAATLAVTNLAGFTYTVASSALTVTSAITGDSAATAFGTVSGTATADGTGVNVASQNASVRVIGTSTRLAADAVFTCALGEVTASAALGSCAITRIRWPLLTSPRLEPASNCGTLSDGLTTVPGVATVTDTDVVWVPTSAYTPTGAASKLTLTGVGCTVPGLGRTVIATCEIALPLTTTYALSLVASTGRNGGYAPGDTIVDQNAALPKPFSTPFFAQIQDPVGTVYLELQAAGTPQPITAAMDVSVTIGAAAPAAVTDFLGESAASKERLIRGSDPYWRIVAYDTSTLLAVFVGSAVTKANLTQISVGASSASGGRVAPALVWSAASPMAFSAPTGDSLPVLDIRPATIYHVHGQAYQEYGVVSYHTVSTVRESLPPTMSPTITSTTGIGPHTVTYRVDNSKGTTTVVRQIIVVQQPTIARVGGASITRYVGAPLDDPGYTVDTKGVIVDPEVAVTNSPATDIYRNLTTPQTYTLTYTMSYKIGGVKFPTFTDQTFTRTVVVNAQKPTIALTPTNVYWRQSVAYNDATVGGIVTTNGSGGVTTNPADPASINTTTVGSTYTIVYTVKNAGGETATATRTVRIIQQPTLVLNGGAMNLKPGDVWTDPGYTAVDAFGNASREVSITGVPGLDLEGRITTAANYTVTYTLRATNTPSTQVTSVVERTRTVNVVAPAGPPKLLVLSKRVYHRHLDSYTDTGVSATDNLGTPIAVTTIITKKRDNSTVALASSVKDECGEYVFAYSVTHNSVTVTATRYVDVYSDLLDDRNFKTSVTTAAARTSAGVTKTTHSTGFEVQSLPGTSDNQRIVYDSAKASCNNTSPFTFMTWIRIAAKETAGTVTLLQTTHLTISLVIFDNVADFFNGDLNPCHVKAAISGPTWSDTYLKLMSKGSYPTEYPFVLSYGGSGRKTSMHDCPRVGEWFWFSLQYDGSKHFIVSLNGIRQEYTYSYYQQVHFGDIRLAHSDNGAGTPLQFELCRTCFIYRFLHIHEIQALYEHFVVNNDVVSARYAAFGTYLDEIERFMDTFKAGTITGADNSAFESALRGIRTIGHCALQKGDGSNLSRALGVIDKFEQDAAHGPLFVGTKDEYWRSKIGTTSAGKTSLYQPAYDYYGFAPYQHVWAQDASKQLHTLRLARGMLFLQQIVWDAGLQATSPYRHYYVSSEYAISFASELRTKQLQDCAEGARWGTATYIKGQTAKVTAAATTMSIVLKIRNRPVRGVPGDYFTAPTPRCTGMWVSSGVMSAVSVPESMINKGIQLCVGTHRNDTSLFEGGHIGGRHTRMDRVATHFLIDRSTVRVYSPVGGNLYVLLPYDVDVGMVTLTATNVVASRMFRIVDDDVTGFHETTTQAQWDAAVNVASGGPPTVDIETDHALVHIPSQWIEENTDWLNDIPGLTTVYLRVRDLAFKYDSLCKNIVVFRGMLGMDAVGAVDHPMLYTSVDMASRSDGGVGWPMVNSPIIASHAIKHWTLNWCVDDFVTWHELGHMYTNRAYAFSNEGEASNELMIIFLLNQTCGYDLESAFFGSKDSGESTMTLDETVVDWMKEDMFVAGTQMNGNYTGYQRRGWHKYVDIVALVGWDGFRAYMRAENLAFERAQGLSTPLDTTDTQRIVRMSLALGIDMAPLMEFWGITDVSGMEAAFRSNVRSIIDGTLIGNKSIYFAAYGPSDLPQDCAVHKCRGVRTLLLYFKSLVPKTNKAALEHIWSAWKRAFPGATPESLKITNANPTDKYLGWWETFYKAGKTWNATRAGAIESRIDAILLAHGLASEPAAVGGCIACANNKPNFNPPSKMHPCWAVMPELTSISAIPNRALTFYVTEDETGFVLKGERDHKGSLPGGSKLPTLQIRYKAKLVFRVSVTTPFYILQSNGTTQMSDVKNQGVTDGVLIWNMEERGDTYYGNAKGGTYRGVIKRVFGVP